MLKKIPGHNIIHGSHHYVRNIPTIKQFHYMCFLCAELSIKLNFKFNINFNRKNIVIRNNTEIILFYGSRIKIPPPPPLT